jgi:DNA-binding FrmR family transcriptional regulator
LTHQNLSVSSKTRLNTLIPYASRGHASGFDLAKLAFNATEPNEMKEIKNKTQGSRKVLSSEIIRVHKILGQLEGVERMIDSHRAYPQVLQQVQAAISGLMSLKMEILKRHLNECLAESTQSANYSKLVGQVLEIVQIQRGNSGP